MAKVFGLESFKDEMLVPFQFRSATVQTKYYTSSLQADAGRAYGALTIRSSWPPEATKTHTQYHPILLLRTQSSGPTPWTHPITSLGGLFATRLL